MVELFQLNFYRSYGCSCLFVIRTDILLNPMFGDSVSSASHGDVFLGVSVLRLISQIPNNSPIPIIVFLGLYAVVGSWQDSYEKERFHVRVKYQYRKTYPSADIDRVGLPLKVSARVVGPTLVGNGQGTLEWSF